MSNASIPPSASHFPKIERYSFREHLGTGGMGVVYRAYDSERGGDVALKALTQVNPLSLYRFKQEFRAVADVSHANLVSLYELRCVGDDWFFTMELIEGRSLRAHLSDTVGTQRLGGPVVGTDETATGVGTEPAKGQRASQTSTTSATPTPTSNSAYDYTALRGVFRQLVRGVHSLHNAGYLHRDIKPSNIMVEDGGRVVLLDFGIIAVSSELRQSGDLQEVAGTIRYMAPEQATAEAVKASDWYAVGCVLYEILTGRRAFLGSRAMVLRAKQTREPAPPSRINPDVPPALDTLCVDLLRIDPDARPDAKAILGRLADEFTTAAPISFDSEYAEATVNVGREVQKQILRDALADTQNGRAVTVAVSGVSGMGKSTLVRDFLHGVKGDHDTVVLAGRCYEQESVPYKAVDSLVDELSKYLLTLPRHEVDILLPRDVLMLARVFPVLRRVHAVAKVRRRNMAMPDAHELRRRAFAALRELFARLASQRAVILFIDDLQWGDVDSAPLLEGLLRPPDAPALLLLYAHRSEGVAHNPLLQALVAPKPNLAGSTDIRNVEIGPLSMDESIELAQLLLRRAGVDAEAEVIARESGGAPYFIHELVRYMSRETERNSLKQFTLEELIKARVKELGPDVRALVEVVALASKPIPLIVAKRAAGFSAPVPRQRLRELGSAHLLLMAGVRDTDLVESYHSRIRAAVVEDLDDETRRNHHQRIAAELRTLPVPDAEALVLHLRGAGELDEAAEYAIRAAEQAVAALAFDRAAEHYQTALELGGGGDNDGGDTQIKLGKALENAGRSAEAADVYVAAATGTPQIQSLQLRGDAALQYLFAGHLEQGTNTLSEVLHEVGIKMPTGSSIVSFLLRRARLYLRGLGYRRRDESAISLQELARIDVCWVAAAGLAMVDNVIGANFQTHHLMLALRSGEEVRIARALAWEAVYSASSGSSRTVARDKADALSKRLDAPSVGAWVAAANALIAYQGGGFRAAETSSLQGVTILREECTGFAWERATLEVWQVWSLYYLGELAEMSRRVESLLAQARERGNLYSACGLRTGVPAGAWLAADALDEGRRHAAVAIEQWTTKGYHLQHYWQALALVNCDLYAGDVAKAHERVSTTWPALTRSQLLRIPSVAIEGRHMRARAAIASAASDSAPARLLKLAERELKAIRKFRNNPWAQSFAALLCAQLAHARGEGAAQLFEEAERTCIDADMMLHALVARRRRGEIQNGEVGAELVAAADIEIRQRGVVNPERWASMIMPLARTAG